MEADLHGLGAQHYDLLLHCGDLAYDMDTSNGRNGDAFMADIQPIAAYLPYMVSAGRACHGAPRLLAHSARVRRPAYCPFVLPPPLCVLPPFRASHGVGSPRRVIPTEHQVELSRELV